MDRNLVSSINRAVNIVALRKESVDRNCWRSHSRRPNIPSLSARRAWIEISPPLRLLTPAIVALRKESVDRNTACRICRQHIIVALRKESVDRNRGGDTHANRYYGRSPQGERG